ncbi:putative ribonuclease H-like domain-containing protein [Tanacetum coccineum]
MELEKVVKERDELKVKIEKWEESSKGLNKLLNSQMSAKDKNSLGYGTQLDEMSNKSETDSEISMSVFEVRSSDEEITPANDRFSKADGYHVVPPPITGNFLTPRADISFAGKSNEVEKSKTKINRDKVIIEDWNSDDEDDVSEVNTVSPVKTNETQTVKTQVDKIGQISQKEGIGFKKIKACFVWWSNQYEIMLKGQNGKRAVHTVSTARPISTARPVSTARPFAPKIAQTGSAIRPIYPRMDNVRPRASYSPIKRSYYTKPAFRPKNLKQDVKTSGVKNMTTAGTRAVVNTGKGKMDNALKKSRWVWRPKGNYIDHESKEKGSFILKKFEYVDPKGISKSVDHAVVDSGCSSHMTGNKAYLSDYEDYNGGFMAFGSDPKRDELKFNLFSVSQMCDKKNSVLFTDTECLILSPSFKLLDESQVVLRAPRQNDVYSLDLKNIVPSGGLENQLNHKVKIIRSDHGTEFKNHAMNVFCAKKWIKREFSVARTPQQNSVAERKNKTLIEAARTMLADSLLPIPFWAEAINTACYVLNRVLVTKPQNKTPYDLLIGKPPSISFMRPFGCLLTILNTLDPLGKFDGKSDEGYLLGYSTSSKAFRVYNKRTKRVEESLHIDFLEDQPNVAGNGPDWMFDLDFLTNIMNYIPVSIENQVIVDAGIQEPYVAGSSGNNKETPQEYILLLLHPHGPRISVKDVVLDAKEKPSENATKDKDVQDSEDVAEKEEQHNLTETEQALKDDLEKLVTQEMIAKAMDDATRQAFEEEKNNIASTKRAAQATSINKLNTGRQSVGTANTSYVSVASTPTGIFSGAYDDEDKGAEAYFNNMDNTIDVSPIPTLRIHKDHLKGQILGDPKSAVQTRGKIQKASSAQQALGKRQLAQNGPEEGIDYDEVFAPVARIEAIRLFLAFASYMGFPVYQMDVKSAFLYDTIEEEVYVHQPLGFVDPAYPHKVYKVVKALYGLHQTPRAWYETLSSFLLENGFRKGTIDKTLFIKKNKSDIMLVQVYVDDIIFGSTKQSMCTEFEDCMHKRFQMSSMGELTFFLGLQVKQQPDGIFISQDKYVVDVLKKFDFLSIKIATTPVESNKPLVKDEHGIDIDVHVYRSKIDSLMYLTASRPDIMFVVCACARHQVHSKASHLNAVKMIFRYLKHQSKLGLWYPRNSPFELEAFSDSNYRGASLDRKSTTGGCQFLGRRLISWQCKNQTIMANSTTKAEYVAAANYCGQVLLIQNQMMDYGFNFMNTKIHIDNKSTISVIKNPVSHSRTKHIEIRFHFIRDCYEKRLIEVIKIQTDNNVVDLLTKGFDVTRFNFLVVNIGMINL